MKLLSLCFLRIIRINSSPIKNTLALRLIFNAFMYRMFEFFSRLVPHKRYGVIFLKYFTVWHKINLS